MAELNEYLEERINSAKQRLSKYLLSEEVKARFTSWTLDEVPNVQRSWEETESHILTALVKKMREIIARWEEDNQVFKIVQESLVKYSQEHYLYFEVQLQNLQSDTIADNVHVEENDVTFPLGAKVIIGVTFPIWVPLSLVGLVIGAPVLGVIAIKEMLEENRKIKYYEADKCAFMAEQSERFLHYIHNGTFVREFVTDLLEGTMMYLKQIEERIPEWIQNHKMFCDHLLEDTRSQQEIQNLYQPIMENGSYIREQLALFGLKEIPANDIKSNELDWKEDTHSLLGCGAFGVVYSGTMTGKGDDKPVALKVPKDALGVKNAIELTAEVALLRKLEHPYIVKFYGTSLLKNSYEVRLVLVMEKCKGSLKSHIFDSPERIPGKCGNPAVTNEASRWVIQIIDALMYIHQQHIVHRDLKLENILLSEDNSVRITDVGVSKPAADITGTIVGNPVYIAPEVFHSKVYDCSADIYSLGIILWEIWYGQQAFAEVANWAWNFSFNKWIAAIVPKM